MTVLPNLLPRDGVDEDGVGCAANGDVLAVRRAVQTAIVQSFWTLFCSEVSFCARHDIHQCVVNSELITHNKAQQVLKHRYR